MELLNHFQQLLYALLTPLFSYMRDAFQWWLAQVLAVPWGRVGDLPGPKILLLIATAGIVAYFLFRAALELYTAGEKAFSAFVTLLRSLRQDSAVHPVRGARRRCGGLGRESCAIVSVAGSAFVDDAPSARV